MPAYKDPKGKWYVSVYYDNWQGIRTRKLKRGFATRKEALEWERIFLMKGKGDLDMSFGAFVELAPGVDALLHVSQISREHVAKPSDVLSIGQEIEAKVVDFNGEDRKISLSMKALEDHSAEQTEE